MNKLLYIVLLYLTLISCSSENEQVLELWSNGKPKIVKEFYHFDTLRYRLIHYYENGKIREQRYLEAGISNGWMVTYYRTSTVKDSIYLNNNIPFTTSKHFHENGKIESKGTYLDGKKDGIWQYYDTLGQMKKSTLYHYGTKYRTSFFNSKGWRTKEIIAYSDGAVKEIISYKDSLRHGEYIFKEMDGRIKLSGYFINDSKHNTRWTFYYPNGKKFKEIEYRMDEFNPELLINLWDENEEITVTDGNGYYKYNKYIDCRGKKILQSEVKLTYEYGLKVKEEVKKINDCY